MDYKHDIFREFSSKITVYMRPAPAKDIRETEDFIRKSLEGLKNGTNLQLVILDKDTREFTGCAGLHNLDTQTPEMGIWLKKSAHGKGYGKESMTAVKKWADTHLKYDFLIYPVADKNIPSRKIPESLGGVIEKEYDEIGIGGNLYHCLVYKIPPAYKE